MLGPTRQQILGTETGSVRDVAPVDPFVRPLPVYMIDRERDSGAPVGLW